MLAAALGALAVVAGCGAEPASAPGESVRVYEMRGVVGALPQTPDGQISIRHEAVPDFVDFAGREAGMAAMTMRFDRASGLDLTGIEAGQKVAFRLEVDWDRSLPAQIVAISPLPPDTELALD